MSGYCCVKSCKQDSSLWCLLSTCDFKTEIEAMDLGKNNYLKNRIVTTIVSKLISHESGVRLALPYLLLFSMEICWSL